MYNHFGKNTLEHNFVFFLEITSLSNDVFFSIFLLCCADSACFLIFDHKQAENCLLHMIQRKTILSLGTFCNQDLSRSSLSQASEKLRFTFLCNDSHVSIVNIEMENIEKEFKMTVIKKIFN